MARMRTTFRPASAAFLLALTLGCAPTAGLPAAVPPASAASAPVGAAPSSAATPAVAPAATRTITGRMRYFGQPLAGAVVTVRRFGRPEALATASSLPDGAFAIALPAEVEPDAILQLTATGGGHTIAAVTQAPARGLLQAGFVMDEATTTALMVLAPRLLAVLSLGTPEAKRAALESLAAAAEALGSETASSLLDPATFDAAVAAVLDATGAAMQTPEAREALARAVPEDAVAAITAEAEALAGVIRDAVAAGLPAPDAALLGPLPVGDGDVAGIVIEDAGGEASRTETPEGTAAVEVVEPEEGRYGPPPGPIAATSGAAALLAAPARLTVRLGLARRLLAGVHRWTAADVHTYRLRLLRWDGEEWADTGLTQDVPAAGPTDPIVAIFTDLAAGAAYRVDVRAYGEDGGAAPTTWLNAATPCLVDFDYRAPSQEVPTEQARTAAVVLDGVTLAGRLTITPDDIPSGTTSLDAALYAVGSDAAIAATTGAAPDATFVFTDLAAGPRYVVKVTARDAGGASLGAATSSEVRFDPDGQDVDPDADLMVSVSP